MKILIMFAFLLPIIANGQKRLLPTYNTQKMHWKDIRSEEAKLGSSIPDCGLIQGKIYVELGGNQPLEETWYCNGVKGTRNINGKDIKHSFEYRTNERRSDDTITDIDEVNEFWLRWETSASNVNGVTYLTSLYDEILSINDIKSIKNMKDRKKGIKGKKADENYKQIYFYDNTQLGKKVLVYTGVYDLRSRKNYMVNRFYLKKCSEVKNLDRRNP